MRKEMTTLGPAVSLATPPANTYTPTPRVEPTPSMVRSQVVRHRDREVASVEVVSSCFLLLNLDIMEENILATPKNMMFNLLKTVTL